MLAHKAGLLIGVYGRVRFSGKAVIAYPRVTELTMQGEPTKQFCIAIWSQDILIMSTTRFSGKAVIAYPRVTELTMQGEPTKQFCIAIWSQDILIMSTTR
ncbi:hypothetical protein AAES_143532 [Amazona aestiva]|uniref:Uncharacterized protein n=1 Tax=Amazona aestiva TaxID=12930 RepID=A0A0Q3PH05_AMAAE|nr:hypothetical protein AAES_143532 [Amazona aestiva]